MRKTHFSATCATIYVLVVLEIVSAGVSRASDTIVPAGADLQAALDNAMPGDTITLIAGASYVGHFRLPSKVGTQYITIRSSALAQLPPEGVRVSPAYGQYMPKIVTPDSDSAITAPTGAHHYRFVGIEIAPAADIYVNDLVRLGEGNEKSASDLPQFIEFDRCYIHGDPVLGSKRGIALNSRDAIIQNCWISDIKAVGQDTQAIAGWNGPGPYQILNNRLEATGENILFGGGRATIPNVVPSDILIRGNYLFKPLTWRSGDPTYAGSYWTVKNLLELKAGRRVTIDGNYLEDNWVQSDQRGLAFQFTTEDPGGNPWVTIEDVVVSNNIISNSAGGVNIYCANPGGLTRLKIVNNLFRGMGEPFGEARFAQLLGSISNITFDHNTVFNSTYIIIFGHVAIPGLVFTNNIVFKGWGIASETLPSGTATLNGYAPGWTVAGNAIIGADTAYYPPRNYFPADVAGVGFNDPANGDYSLSATSPYKNGATDGTDPGVITAALEAANQSRGSINTVSVGYGPASPVEGGSLAINWMATAPSTTDTIGLFRTGSDIPAWLQSTGGAGSGSATIIAPAGASYELRYYSLNGAVLSAQVSVRIAMAAPQTATAGFLAMDTTTQGKWQNMYGSEGYAVAGDQTSNPAYGTVSVSRRASTIWAGVTPDVRALVKPSKPAERIAATWFAPTSFIIDPNITDWAVHKIALYCLDWDNSNRVEKIDVLDPYDNVLDTRSVSNFSAGVYLVWNVSGRIRFRVTLTTFSASHALVNGVFFGDAPLSVSVTPASVTIPSGGVQQFTATVLGTSNTAVDWAVTPAIGQIVNGFYTAPAITSPQTVTITATSQQDKSKSGTATVNLVPLVSVSLSPSSVTLGIGGTQQFTAVVTGTSNTEVTWSFSPTLGTLVNGLYTAPAALAPTVTTTQLITVTATSKQDNTKYGAATVNLVPSVAVSILPVSVTLGPGGARQFAATVTGTVNTGVTWSLSPAVGQVVNGLYTAPADIVAPQTVVLTATSQQDSSKSAAATINLAPLSSTGPLPIFGTGITPTGTLAADGAVDAHYQLVASPDTTAPGPNAFVMYSDRYPIGAWAAGTGKAKWIAPQVSQYYGNAPGSYTYRTTFDLTGFNANTVKLTGSVIVDDSVVITLNGATVAAPAAAYYSAATFSISSGFVAGLNTLDFVVKNGGTSTNPTGLFVDISGTASVGSTPVPVVGVSVAPSAATLGGGATQQFAATVTGTTNSAVNWTLDPPVGQIVNGLYTAPASVTSAQTVTITATSQQDSTKFGTATVSLAPPASVVPIAVYGTGTLATGALASDTTVDLHYKLTSSPDPSYPGPSAYVIYSDRYPIGAWSAGSGKAKWISPQASQYYGNAGGTYVYATTFDLTGYNPATAKLSGTVLVDDSVVIKLNGNTAASPTAAYYNPATFSITSGFVAGVNTLEFVVKNTGVTTNPTGILVEISGTAALSGGSPPPISVTISPTTVNLSPGGGQQFIATVTGATNTAVNWSVSPAVGTLTGGYYTAPGSFTSSQIVTITATSQQDLSKSATATVNLVPAAAPVAIPVFGTGVNTGGGLASDGTVDLHYSLVSSADPTSPGPNAYVVGTLPPGWAANGPASKWIAASATPSKASSPGAYTFRTSFDLTGYSALTAVLTGKITADDSVVMKLNGTVVAQSLAFGTITPFTVATGFVAGVNTIDFVVTNAGLVANPSGLRVDLSGTAVPLSPVGSVVTLVVSPKMVSLGASAQQTFAATVGGTTNTAVTWTLSPNIGTMTGNMYTAPASITTTQTVTLTATSAADSAVKDTATITLIPASPVALTLYGTGVVTPGTLAADRSVDAHYTVVSSIDASAAGPSAYVVPSTALPAGWLANGPNSKWISASQMNSGVSGTYTYRTTFDLTGFNPATALITGKVSVDNSVVVKLNGVTVTQNIVGYESANAFTINTGFVAGVNTLDFVVTNDGFWFSANATGLRVELSGTALPASSSPPGVTVAVSPKAASLGASGQQTFVATVGGTANTAVSWTLSPNTGTMTGNTYTAPPSISGTQTVTLTATSTADPMVKGTATITLLPATPIALGLYGTGVITPGLLAPDRSVDAHYTVVSSADASAAGPSAYVVSSGALPTGWLVNGTNSKWISASQTNSAVSGAYIYRTTFDLTGFNPLTASITGKVSADNSVVVKLNGVEVTKSVAGSESATPFAINTGFASGMNTLDFVVTNDGFWFSTNPTGLRVELSGTAIPAANPVAAVTLAVSPKTASLRASAQQTFTAKVSGTSNQGVSWTMSPNVGTLVGGVYTAPPSITTPQVVTITATSVSDATARDTVIVALTPVPANPVALQVFGTGVTATSTLAGNGVVDAHYRLVTSVDRSAAGPNVYAVPVDAIPAGWVANGKASRWIAPAVQQAVGNAAGTYIYRTTFDLTGFNVLTAALAARVAGDDSVVVKLNGATVSQSAIGYIAATLITINTGFIAGVNNLDFVVTNAGTFANPTGLQVDLSGTAVVSN